MENEEVGTLRLGTTNRRLDAAAIEQGVKKECPFRPGLFVLVLPAASYNPRYRQALQSARGLDAQDEAFLNRYDSAEFVASAYVGDMIGLYDAAGNPVPYTRERGLRILSDPSNADVLEWIAGEAHLYGQFYTEAVETEAGN